MLFQHYVHNAERNYADQDMESRKSRVTSMKRKAVNHSGKLTNCSSENYSTKLNMCEQLRMLKVLKSIWRV